MTKSLSKIVLLTATAFLLHGCAANGGLDPNFEAFMAGLGQAAGAMNNSINSNRGVYCNQTPGGYYCH